MYDKKTLTHLTRFTSNGEGRFTLEGVRFEHNRAIATDSYHLLEVSNPNGIHVDAEPFTLHRDNVKDIIKQLSPKSETLMCDSDEYSRCGTGYPNSDMLFDSPVQPEAITVHVNPKYLANIAESFKGSDHIAITIEDPKKVVRFAGEVQGNKARALLMPVRPDR